MKDVEIEIKVQVEDKKPLLGFLEKQGKFLGRRRQIDEYFVPAHRDFIATWPVDEWLRLRDSDGAYSINYKNWHHDRQGVSHACDEYETGIEDIQKARQIFKALDIRPIVTVDKTREAWTYGDYEIAVDSVKNLDDYIEIEYIGKRKVEPKRITDEMVGFLKKLGCGKIRRNHSGYPYDILFKGKARNKIV